MREQEAIMRIQANEDVTIEEVCKHLRTYTQDISHTLASLVASLCDITMDELMEGSQVAFSNARWLYWYVYRQLTSESIETIAMRTHKYRKFSERGVRSGISKMSMLIAEGTIWTKRYNILKKVIRVANRGEEMEQPIKDINIRIEAPKGVRFDIKQE